MAPRITYLDQNKWIELARAVYGNGNTHLLPIVEFIRQVKASGLAVFPLSLAHYMETSKRAAADQQERLGTFMWEVSEGNTLASPTSILRHEIDMALQHTFQTTLNVRPFTLVSKGLAHAADGPGLMLELDDPDRVFSEEQNAEVEAFANRVFAYGVLTGTTPWGPALRPRPDLSPPGKQFVGSVADLRTRLAGASEDVRRMTVYSVILREMFPELLAALQVHGVKLDQFAALGLADGPSGYIRFLEQMPSVKVNAHLYLQWLQNPQLPSRETDLNDWYYVGAAVAYADVVVTEKHFAHVVNAGNLGKKAVVISDTADLPGTLSLDASVGWLPGQ